VNEVTHSSSPFREFGSGYDFDAIEFEASQLELRQPAPNWLTAAKNFPSQGGMVL
jgi:hypothetical protein